ncbi:NAD(P)/FAD-dependent oxidoreductase [Aidingimonas halophila]|uniref:D-amino-acid dehydrogenase n=1 Tax=Aidingimonas halophila TaxID=574349 RepID=A0A1H3HTP6_9GAMM|nr:FAD-dependent oxidoreductase [Aidingimonas halophila]GHC38972.1 amino acid dehydrogenase [Aidingimonas halophila]SDY18605.1 D-amino-acid dehydrogenase [Aidingimonas halophila]
MGADDTAHSGGYDADIVVIGAGIVGVSTALALSRQGLDVLVLDRQSPGMGASYGNAGHMATEQVFPIADTSILKRLPRMLTDPMGPLRLDWKYVPKALPWFARLLWNLRQRPYQNSVAGLRALNERSLSAWKRLLASIDQPHLLKTEGSFLVHESEKGKEESEHLFTRMSEQGVPVEPWTGEAIRHRIPELSNHIKGGLFFPETGHVIDPLHVVNSLVDAAKLHGAEFKTADVMKAEKRGKEIRLTTHSGKIVTKRVVISCGAHAKDLTRELTGIHVPLDTERGYHLMLPGEAHRLPVAVTSLERKFIMTPMSDGLRLAGTVEFAGLHQPPDMRRAWLLHQLSEGLFQSRLDNENATPWMGFRPSLPDSLPVIDRVGDDGEVLLAFGHHHLGLTQAAITAEIINHLTLGGNQEIFQRGDDRMPLKFYKVTRFS